jgi:thiol-disulfide isomerase/thioredoxin
MLTLGVISSDSLAQGARPAWHSFELIDVRTGKTFTLATFTGKTVFVQPMATWCIRCKKQLNSVAEARLEMLSDEVVFLALSVEGNLPAHRLASYAESNGWTWTFAVATADLLIALVDSFGHTITNPSATPHFLIGPEGVTGPLATGLVGPNDILTYVRQDLFP